MCTPLDREDPLGSDCSARGSSQRTTTRVCARRSEPTISLWTGAVVTTPGCITS